MYYQFLHISLSSSSIFAALFATKRQDGRKVTVTLLRSANQERRLTLWIGARHTDVRHHFFFLREGIELNKIREISPFQFRKKNRWIFFS